jgi:NitT/TauT family transport system permease protein
MFKKKNWINIIFSLILFLGLWELIDYVFKIQEVILPTPYEILTSILSNYLILINDLSITLLEAFLGFLLGSFFGIVLALLFLLYSGFKNTCEPYVIALQTMPMLAVAPLLVIWFGSGILSKTIMAALVTFFPVVVNTYKGLSSVDSGLLDLFSSFNATKMQMLLKLRIPNSLPYVFSAFKTSMTFSIVGATIAEFTGASAGIGHLIVNSSYYLDTSLMFAGIFMISLAGIVIFYVIELLEKKIVFWQ